MPSFKMKRLLYSIFLFVFATSLRAQSIDTLVQFDYRSALTEIQVSPDESLIALFHEGASTDDAYGHRNGMLSKYSSEGLLEWVIPLAFSTASDVQMTLDPFGNIYVAFYADDLFQMRKLDTNGQVLWEKNIADPTGVNFNMEADALYANEHFLYLGASFFNTNFFEIDTLDYSEGNSLCLLQFDLDGKAQWIKLFGSTSSADITGIRTDREENVYFSTTTFNQIKADSFEIRGAGRIGAIGKINVEGVVEWLNPIGFDETGHRCHGLELDKAGNIYAHGNINGGVILAKLDSDGQTIWKHSTPIQGGSVGSASWYDIYIDEFNRIYTVGFAYGRLDFGSVLIDSDNGLYTADQLLGAFNPDGTLRWVKSIPSEKKAELFTITGFKNKLFMGGYNGGVIGSQSIAFENYFTLLRFDDASEVIDHFYAQKMDMFPNPNPGRFCLYLNDFFQTGATIRVYNMLGQLLYKQHIEALSRTRPFLNIELPSRIPGHYVLTVEKGDQRSTMLFAVY